MPTPTSEPSGSRPPHDFEAIYASTTPPWDIGRPQPAFASLAAGGGLVGRVLDVGCGTGEHALLAASLGHDVVGIDIADTVLDCGLFHSFDDDDRALFVAGLALIVPAGGRYHMLCFSERQPGDWGPRRVAQDEIRASFAEGWLVDSIDPTILEINIDPAGAQAWQVAATRI